MRVAVAADRNNPDVVVDLDFVAPPNCRVFVVVRPLRVINDATTARGSAPFQTAKLRNEPRRVEQFDLATIYRRQKLAVNVALRTLGSLIADAMDIEALARP